MADEPLPCDAELEASVEEAIAVCGGDPRAAVRTLIVANAYAEACFQAEIDRLTQAVSRGYVRRDLRTPEGDRRQTGSGK